MWQIDTKVNNYGSAWVDMYLLDTSDPVEGDADPGGVPINIGDLEPSNETLYRLANNLKIIEENCNSFAGLTIATTPATIGALQTTLDALGSIWPNGANLYIAFAGGTYTIPAAGITLSGFTGANEIRIWDGTLLRSGTYTASAIILQKATANPIFNFEDINTSKIRVNGITLQTTGNYNSMEFYNCKSKILIDSVYVDHQSAGSGAQHVYFENCPDFLLDYMVTDKAYASIEAIENSFGWVQNSGTVGGGADPTVRSIVSSNSKISFYPNNNTYSDSLGDTISGGTILTEAVRLQLSAGAGANFGVGSVAGTISTSPGGATGYIFRIDNDHVWIWKQSGTWTAGHNVDNVIPYVGSKGTISLPLTVPAIVETAL